MASSVAKLIPSDPDKVMVIRRVTPDIMVMSTPFLRFGRIKIGGRGTVVRMQSGGSAVFSPVALTKNVQMEMESMGPAKYIVALDQEHHIFLEEWHKAYPEAKVIGPESLPSHREKQGYFKIPGTNWHLFTTSARKSDSLTVDSTFDKEFDMEYVDSHVNKELVFNHKPTRTLIEADLMFNLPATEQFSKTDVNPNTGFLTKLFLAIGNTQGQWQRRFLWYGASSSDRPAFNKGMAKIASWDFDRIIPCHGDVVESGGKGIFERVMAWHLDAERKAK